MKQTLSGIVLLLMAYVSPSLGQTLNDKSLRLAVDHFSRTITPKDTAIYRFEVSCTNNAPLTVKLEVEPSHKLKLQFNRTLVKTPALVHLRVTIDTPDPFVATRILAITARDTSDTTRITRLNVRLHVVSATAANPKLTLSAPFGALKKNLPQSLEGAVLPPDSVFVRVYLFSPSHKRDTLVTRTGSNGLFHVNSVFTEAGPWQAFAVAYRLSAIFGPPLAKSDTINFAVKRDRLRLTVAAGDSFRYKPNQTRLRAVGQITPDYARGAHIEVTLTNPSGSKQGPRTASIDSVTGKFSASFPVTEQGVYQIEAVADTAAISFGWNDRFRRNSDEFLYASTGLAEPINEVNYFKVSAPAGSRPSVTRCAATAETSLGYAIIVIGYSSTEYYMHLNMAQHLRRALIIRRGFEPDDILLTTLSLDAMPPSNAFQDVGLVNISRTQDELLHKIDETLPARDSSQPAFALPLLFFWIGYSESDGISTIEFTAGSSELAPHQIKDIYEHALLGRAGLYNQGIIFMHAGSNSGGLLKNLDLHKIGVGNIFAGTANGKLFFNGTSGNADERGNIWTEIPGLPSAPTTTPPSPSISLISPPKVLAIAIDPKGRIYAGTEDRGVYRRDHDDTDWLAINSGLFGTSLNIRTLIIGFDGKLFAGTNNGVYNYSSELNSWNAVGASTLTNRVNALAFKANGELYAGTDGGVYKYNFLSGSGWSPVGRLSNVTSLAINSEGIVYAGRSSVVAGSGDGVYSLNPTRGADWEQETDMQGKNISTLAVAPRTEDIIAGTVSHGVYRLSANCSTPDSWCEVNNGLDATSDKSIKAMAVNSRDDLFILTSSNKIFRAVLNEVTYDDWSQINDTRLPSTESIHSLAINEISRLAISTTPRDPSTVTLEEFSESCGIQTFSGHFVHALALQDRTVRGAFKHAGTGRPGNPTPTIDDDLDGQPEDLSAIAANADYGNVLDAAGQISLGCNVGGEELEGRLRDYRFASITDSYQDSSYGTVSVTFDNPSPDFIRRVTLTLTHKNLKHCYQMRPRPGLRDVLWETEVSYPDTGLYHGYIFAEIERNGMIEFEDTSFVRIRYATEPPRVFPIGESQGLNRDINVNVGVDGSSRSTLTNVAGSVGVTFFTYNHGGLKYLSFPMLSFSSDADRQWVSFSPLSVNIAGLLLRGKIFSDIWLHAGAGYVVRDRSGRSTRGHIIFAGGIRTRL